MKKLPRQQKAVVEEILENPEIGELKVGDLAGVRIHKFKVNKPLMMLAYEVDEVAVTLYLLKLGSHENFYRDLKK